MSTARHRLHMPGGLADKLADTVVTTMGSWKFILVQTAVVTLWISINILAYAKHFDPYPFILLNLLFSTQAAYASPLILMASNRTSLKDRARDDVEAREVEQLLKIQDSQLDMLQEIRLLSQEIHSALGKIQTDNGAKPT